MGWPLRFFFRKWANSLFGDDPNMLHGWASTAALEPVVCEAIGYHVRGGQLLHPISTLDVKKVENDVLFRPVFVLKSLQI